MLYLGIDLTEEEAMISYAYQDMTEPVTVASTLGADDFGIPVAACFREETASWVYGDDAVLAKKEGSAFYYDRLLPKALRGDVLVGPDGEVGAATLLARYLKRLIYIAGNLGPEAKLGDVVLTIDGLDSGIVKILDTVTNQMALGNAKMHYCDRQESFYYYVVHQKPDLRRHNSALFELNGDTVEFKSLEKGVGTKPARYTIRRDKLFLASEDKDRAFTRIAEQCLGRLIYDAVYLVGTGFEGDWMKESVNFLIRGRKVYTGRNLFTKGACFAALDMGLGTDTDSRFIGEHEMKFSLKIKVTDRGVTGFHTVVKEGVVWYEGENVCEVIADGKPVIEFWMDVPGEKDAKVEALELRELPERANRTTRIMITAKPLSDKSIKVLLEDVGLGNIFPGTHQKWAHTCSIEE